MGAAPAAASPLSPLGQLGGWLGATALHVALGLAVSAALAGFMRRRGIHWMWALALPVLMLLARPALGGLSFTLALAGAWAAARTRRWQREDREAPSAPGMPSRAGPLSALPGRLRDRLERGRRLRLRPGPQATHALPIGRDERGREVAIPVGGPDGGRHTLVVGATGSGKTHTQTLIATEAVARGAGAVVVDPKGDRAMRAALRRAAGERGVAFLEWTPGGPAVYNPFARGTETEIADKALAGERFTEPHYLRQAQRYLGHAVRTLRAAGITVTLRALVQALDPAALERLARRIEEPRARPVHDYLDSLTARQRSDLSGVRDRLAIVAESEVGPWLEPEQGAARAFDLLEAVASRSIAYFALQADSRPLLGPMVGAAIVQDLLTTMAAQRSPVATIVVLDEFSTIATEQVVRLFGRARSAGFSLLLGTQELSDLRIAGRERLLEQILGNLSVLIAHRQVVPESAELLARAGGQRAAWRVAHHSDGRTVRTRTREPLLDADRVMRLPTGWAAVLALGRGDPRVTHIRAP